MHIGEIMVGGESRSEASSAGLRRSGPLARYQRADDTRDRAEVPLELREHLRMVDGAMSAVRRVDLWASSKA
jgi:hypothetical protein